MKKTFAELCAEQAQRQKRRPKEEEHRLQCACVRWFHYEYPHLRYALFAVPNGGRRDKTTGAKLKAEGVLAGVSDLVLLKQNKRYGALLIEMKTPDGHQSAEQKDFEAYCQANDYCYALCRSYEDFQRIVKQYLGTYPTTEE